MQPISCKAGVREGFVLLSLRLMRSSDGTRLWSENFDAKLSDIFDLEEEIQDRGCSTANFEAALLATSLTAAAQQTLPQEPRGEDSSRSANAQKSATRTRWD
jgi:hypothetical protein